jgi:predicted RNase H-like HicB family nuclease
MAREFKATFIHRGEWWIGWSDDVPGANAQERTLDEARESLKEAVADILAFDAEHGDTSSFDPGSTETIHETLVVEAA